MNKMVSSRQKGRATELKAKKYLESEGWNVCLTPPPQMWKSEQDFFGCWDIIAVKPGVTQYIQVKLNRWGDLRECIEFSTKYGLKCEAMRWMQGRYVRKKWQKPHWEFRDI